MTQKMAMDIYLRFRFFATSKPKLQDLRLDMPAITPRTVVSDALRAVGGNTGALQKIYIWYEGRLYRRALQQLASANMQLENINFEFVETKLFNHVAYIVDIFEAFFPFALC